jgi:chromosome segregation ATPase
MRNLEVGRHPAGRGAPEERTIMATLFKNLLGNGSAPELTEDLRTILEEIGRERAHCDALVNSARASITRIHELGEPLEKAGSDVTAMTARIGELEQRMSGLERLTSYFQNLDEQAERLRQNQMRAEERAVQLSESAQRIEALLGELGAKVDLALEIKEQLGSFLELEPPFRRLQGDAETLRTQVAGATEQLGRLREQQERAMDAHKGALAKLDAFDARHEQLARTVQDSEQRVAGLEHAVRSVDEIRCSVDEAKRQLGTVKALGDYVAQKTSALEAQRQVVERAVARAETLDHAMRQVDDGVRRQQDNAAALAALQEQVAGLQSLHEMVVQRAQEVDQVQQESDEQIRRVRTELSAAREEVRRSAERFDFERRGLESVNKRVDDLRGAVTDFETRFAGLAAAQQTSEELGAQLRALTSQVETVATEVGRLDDEKEKVHGLRRDLDTTLRSAQEAGERVARLEEAKPAVEAVLRDYEQLRSAHALMKDALERTQLASGELARMRDEQAETRTWLGSVQQSLGELGGRVAELRRIAPTVELVQAQVQRVNESIATIESRRDFVEEMQRRLAELGALGGTLDDRGRELQSRMEAAEQRFVSIAARAEEAERLGLSITGISSALEKAERDVGEVGRSVTALEARCESIESLAERTRVLRQELEQRQHALEQAAEDLERASQLRQEAAAAAQQLDERARQLGSALETADRQTERVEAASVQLEERADALRFVDKRFAQFEERMARWDLVEQEVARSLEQLAARQSTIEALQADIERMFAMAEKTATNVRAISAAQREIEENRALLERVTAQLREVDGTLSSLDERRRQTAQAESRLARAEALLMDVRSSLEVLQAQKVIVDQAIDKAGSLQFLLKQAEATIEALRDEREMMTRVRTAVAAAQDDESDSEGEMVIVV